MIGWLEENRKFSVIFLIIIAVEIFLVSSIPGKQVQGGINLSTIYHIVVFFLLGFFLLISINKDKEPKTKPLIFTVIISIIYAILDEAHQFFVPLRTPSIQDLLVDSAGIFLSTLVYLYYKRKARQ